MSAISSTPGNDGVQRYNFSMPVEGCGWFWALPRAIGLSDADAIMILSGAAEERRIIEVSLLMISHARNLLGREPASLRWN